MLALKIAKNLPVFALATAASFGATPVARVISNEPIDVDGITAPARNYTPVAVGNEISTQAGVAVVQFKDGSSVSLQPNSQMRLDGQADAVQVRITRGTATYAISTKSHLKIVNSRGETLNRMLEKALPDATAMTRNATMAEPAVMYRSSSRLPGGLAPTGAVSSGSFFGASFHADASGKLSILLPSGLSINLNSSTDPTTGKVVYTVASVTVVITTPSGATVSVTTDAASDPNNAIFGSSVSVPTNVTSGSSASGVTFTSTSGTTVDPATTLTQAATTATNTAIQTGVAPPNTAVPTPDPVKTGTFSGSAS
jgi:hypothetical protein